MDFILDNKDTEKEFQQLLELIKSRKNGEVSDAMKNQGISYKLNWGISIIDFREIASMFEKNHLLALKLWNKQWRETMILATLLDAPKEVSEEQMDFWVKTIDTLEIAEQASTNLWVKCKFAYIKALEWCRGKKHIVRFTGVHLMGRLALTDKLAIDEMFEPFFEELMTLSKDEKLYTPIYRSVIAMGKRSLVLNAQCIELSKTMQLSDSENSVKLGEQLFEELNSDYLRESIKN